MSLTKRWVIAGEFDSVVMGSRGGLERSMWDLGAVPPIQLLQSNRY